MPDYDKIYERVVRRGDEILEQRRKKAVRIKQTSYAVSGVCAAVITGVGIWRMTNIKKLPENSFPEIETIEEITTNTEKSSVLLTTSTAVSDTATTMKTTALPVSTSESKISITSKSTTVSAVSGSVRTSAGTSSAVTDTETAPLLSETSNTTAAESTVSARESAYSQTAITTTAVKQTAPYNTSSQTYSDTSTQTARTTVLVSCTTVSTRAEAATGEKIVIGTSSNTTAYVANQDTTETESLNRNEYPYNLIFRKFEFPQNETSNVYCFDRNINNTDDVGELIEKIKLKEKYPVNGEIYDWEAVAGIFTLKGYSPAVAVAVQFNDSDNYCQYVAEKYDPATLGDLISAFDLSADDLSSECKYWNTRITGINKEKVLEMIASETSAANVNDYCSENKIMLYSELKFTLSNSRINGTLGIDSQGYIMIKINRMTDVCFYIGEDKANEIIDYITG